MTRWCSDAWTPRVGTLCWRVLDRLSVRRETRGTLSRLVKGDLSSALRQLARAGMIEATGGHACASTGWAITDAGRAVLGSAAREPEPPPERLPQREATRTLGGRWLLGCGIHTGRRKRERCPVCDRAFAETLAALDGDALRRYHAERARQTRAQQVREEKHGTLAGEPPRFNAVTIARAREARKEGA